MAEPVLRKVDAVTVSVPDLDSGIGFYVNELGQTLRWRNDAVGQAGLAVPEADTEIVLTTGHGYEPNWLVSSAGDAATRFERAGGTIIAPPVDIPVGRLAVVQDPFGNVLVLLESGTVARPTRAEWAVFILAVVLTCLVIGTMFSVRPF
jgi:predicted enzyme related to lactoylglutathione lyase